MRRYIIRRLLQIVLTFVLFVTLVYFLLEAQPGDYGQTFLNNPKLTQAQRDALRAQLGLDRPLLGRYLHYMGALFRGNLGVSFQYYPRPVIDVIAERAPRTVLLFFSAQILSFIVGFTTGKIMAWKRGQALEYGLTIGGSVLYTVFTPWFALMMMWFFAVILKIFPVGKFVTPIVWQGAPVPANTLFLRMLLTIFVASVAIFVGLLVARRLNPCHRRTIQWGVAGIILAGLLAYWIPSGLSRYALDILYHVILPVLTLTLINFAGTMLLTRNSMLETMREDYIMAARAKGLPERVIRDKHAARNAMLPVVTSFVFALAFVLDGGVMTETIFSWPGMGLTLLESAMVQDIPMATGALVFTGILALFAHLVADLLYAYLDPRIRYA